MMLYKILKGLKAGTENETNGRHIVPALAVAACQDPHPNVIDVGAGYGVDLQGTAEALKQTGKHPSLYAIESYPRAVSHLIGLGVSVHNSDIEKAELPFASEFFDIVICNQVLEHTKEIFWIISELTRVTKIGGAIIIGVPNLGSLHNRISLLFGRQPPAIQVFGPHVRGYTVPGMVDFLERGSVLKVKKILGGNFYPFPPSLSRTLSLVFPGLSVSSFYVVERISSGNFLSILESADAGELVDTPYFRGN